jgi:hypothetical protein
VPVEATPFPPPPARPAGREAGLPIGVQAATGGA